MSDEIEGLAVKASEALKGSVKLSNEIIGVMNLLDVGLPLTPGLIKAMRRYAKTIDTFIDAIASQGTATDRPSSAQDASRPSSPSPLNEGVPDKGGLNPTPTNYRPLPPRSLKLHSPSASGGDASHGQ